MQPFVFWCVCVCWEYVSLCESIIAWNFIGGKHLQSYSHGDEEEVPWGFRWKSICDNDFQGPEMQFVTRTYLQVREKANRGYIGLAKCICEGSKKPE